jgi:hypothetical protein
MNTEPMLLPGLTPCGPGPGVLADYRQSIVRGCGMMLAGMQPGISACADSWGIGTFGWCSDHCGQDIMLTDGRPSPQMYTRLVRRIACRNDPRIQTAYQHQSSDQWPVLPARMQRWRAMK